jgi:hypothetical protein
MLFGRAYVILYIIRVADKKNLEKKHPLPIDLSTENKKAKRSAYEKERRPGQPFNRKWKDKMNKLYK